MSPLIRKLETLLVQDPDGRPLAPETRRLIEQAILLESGKNDPPKDPKPGDRWGPWVCNSFGWWVLREPEGLR